MTALVPPPIAPPHATSSYLGASPIGHPPAQLATWLTCAAAMVVVGVASGLEPWAVGGALALGAGAVTSVATPVGTRFANLAGGFLAVTVGGVLLIAILMGSMIGIPVQTTAVIPFVALFALGLDWRRVDRLRPLVLLSGLAVVLAVTSGEPWTYVGGGIWLLLALTTLHLLESDRRAALAHIHPLATGGPPPEPAADLVATIATGVVVAIVLAVLLSAPSCQNPFRDRHTTPKLGAPQRSESGGSGTDGQGSSGSGGSSSGGGATGRSGSGSGGSRGSGGGASGSSGGGGTAAHRYVPNSDGDFLVPDRTGRGRSSRIPGPTPASGWLGNSATERGADGSTRVYRRGADGTTRITVTDADGTTRTYRYDPRPDGTSRVTESDAAGRPQRSFTYDPDGRLVDGEPSNGASGSGSDSGSDESGSSSKSKPKADKAKLSLPSGGALLVVLGAAALVGLATWLLLRHLHRPPPPPGPPWAVDLARRIGNEGAKRGRPRRPGETIVAYTDALAAGPLPDRRLARIGRVLDAALFTAAGVSETEQQEAISSWDAAVAEHPRRRREPAAV